MQEIMSWYLNKRVERTLNELAKNGFNAYFAETKRIARDKALELIPVNALVGIGGSLTIREIGLVEALIDRGNAVFQHWQTPPGENPINIMKQETRSDIFLTSSNAITESGKLINIDGTGNRVSAMIFGPPTVIVVVGVNKIVRDTTEGLQRVRQVSAPMNARRLNLATPCAKSGVCTDCTAKGRICRVVTILERKPANTNIVIVMVGERLGF